VDVAAVEVAGVADMPRPTGDRASLGVPDDRRLALVFGEPHAAKDLATAVQAFEGLDSWHLLVAGRSANWIADWLATTGMSVPANVTLLPGPATEHIRLLAHHLADAAILSFIPGHRYDSGTLADAIAVGLPVVVSTPSLAAGTVERFAIGATFPAGDATALAAALQALPTAGDPTATSDPAEPRLNFDAGFDAARHALSFTTLAGIYLDAAGLVATTDRAAPISAAPTPAAPTPLDGPPDADQAPM
jgi:glycosyltransferase involved in cell wall biosynthesis